MPKDRHSLRPYIAQLRVVRKNILADRVGAVAGFCINFSLFCVILSLYKTGMGDKTAAGVTFTTVAWSMVCARFLEFGGAHLTASQISSDVHSGAIAMHRLRPWNYLFADWVSRLGANSFYFFMFVLYFLVAYLVAGWPTIALPVWQIAPVILLTYLGGYFLRLFMYSILGLSAFWIEDAGPVQRIFDRLINLIGGTMIPIAFFPGAVRTVIEWSPIGASSALTQVFSPDIADHLPRLFLSQVVSLTLTGIGLVAIWHLARRRIVVNGG